MALGNTLGLGIVLSAQDLASGPLGKVDRAFTRLDDHVGFGATRMQSSFGGLGGHLMSFASGALASFGLLKTINVAAEFQDELAKVKAVTNATSDEMERLRKAAMQAGIATQFDPTEATRALLEIAQAGYSTDESIQLLIPTLDLAAASFGELTPEMAAGLATQTMKAFGIETRDASFAVDQMLMAVNAFSLKTSDLPLALGTAARGAQLLNQSLDETLISLGLVKNTMPHIERASTAVAVAMERLVTSTTQNKLRSIGVAVADAKGNFRNFLDVIADLQPRLAKMTPNKRAGFLRDAFGTEGLAGVSTIMTQLQNGVRTTTGEMVKGAAAVGYFRDQFAHAEGTAARFRETMLATLKGQSKLLLGSIKTLAIDIGMAFVEVLAPVLHAVTALLNRLILVVEGMSPGVRRLVAGIVLAGIAVAGFGTAVLLLQRGWFMLRAAMLAARIAAGQFIVALGPITLILVAIAAVVAGFVIAYQRNFGGLADVTDRIVHKVTLAYRALAQLFSDGGFSGAVRYEIDRAENSGLKRFVITMYMIGYRLVRLWEGIKEGFVAAIEAARPAFEALIAAFHELGDEIAGLIGDITGSASSLPSQQFVSFGQIVGAVWGTLVGWLVTAVGWVVRFTSGVVAGFRAMEEYIGPVFKLLGAALVDLRDAFYELFGIEKDGTSDSTTLGDALRTLGKVVGYIAGGAIAALAMALTVLVKVIEYVIDAVTWLKDAIVSIGEFFSDAASDVAGFFSGVSSAVSGVMSGVVGVFSGIAGMVMKVVSVIRDAVAALVEVLEKALEMVKKFFDGIWDGLKGIGGAIGEGAAWAGGKAWGAAESVGGFVGDAASSIFSGPSLGDLVSTATNLSSTPSAADAEAQAKFMGLLSTIAHGQDASAKPPTTVNVQLQVDGEMLARATAKANEDQARRAFLPIPVGAF